MTKINVSLKELVQFIVESKIRGYATHKKRADSSRLNSKDYTYQRNDFSYRDSYFGNLYDLGQEIVWKNEVPLWGINYYGGMKPEWRFLSEETFVFLRKILSKVEVSLPFRGPHNMIKDDLEYINEVVGDIQKFNGHELIFRNNKLIYDKVFHGGIILSDKHEVNFI